MDTPINNNCNSDRNLSGSSFISKFEDSPVFNYISSLSPIKQFRLNHSSQSFPLLSFTSPQSLQTPPPSDCPKDSSVTSGNHALDALVNCSQDDSKGSDVPRSSCDVHSENKDKSDLGREVNVAETNELLIVKDECLSPESTSAVGSEMLPRETELLPESQIDLLRIEVEHNKEVCDWEKFISNASEIFNCQSPTKGIPYEDLRENNDDQGTLCFIQEFLQTPNENVDDSQKVESTETSQVSSLGALDVLNSEIVHHAKAEVDDKQTTSRRCLIYEMSGTRYRKMISDTPGGSPVSNSVANQNTLNEKCLVASKQVNKSESVLRGIGLHLNALAGIGRDNIIVKRENLTCRRQLISTPSTSFDTVKPNMENLNPPLGSKTVEKGNEVQEDNARLSETVCENSSMGDAGIGLAENSPKKKRRKQDNFGDPESCKRCNCKKSKCLKLYCECFAAGLYCVEPCNCHNCFNKPAHEDIVLETRRQIESRNPLAFAPKVVMCYGTPNTMSELKKTPASARHKRGCNCKKSGCLKKYCECYQGGVGCSLSCRCEGCKNTFGHKEGLEGSLFEEANISHMTANNVISHDDVSKICHENQETPEPSTYERQLVRQPFHFDGSNPPIMQPLQSLTSLKTEESNPITMVGKHGEDSEFLKSDDYSLPTTNIKSTSPNCKRISSQNHGFETSTGWKTCRKLILRSIPSSSTTSKEQESSKAQKKLL